jgi:hypothetical protein
MNLSKEFVFLSAVHTGHILLLASEIKDPTMDGVWLGGESQRMCAKLRLENFVRRVLMKKGN